MVFTGGGSEANNLAIKGVALATPEAKRHVVTSGIEHPSVLNTCEWLEKKGFTVTYLPVDRYGLVKPKDLEAAIRDQTCLVSIMLANNETGSVQPVAELSRIARAMGVPFHTDAVQAIGKMPVDVEELDIDLLTLAGHKFHGPKGVGALYVRQGIELDPRVSGGGQEGGLRAGTENVPGICGLGKAAELAIERMAHMERVHELRDRLERGIEDIVLDVRLNGHRQRRLPNTLNLTFPGVRGESLVLALDRQGIAVSSGSACHAGQAEPSHALTAMGLSDEAAHCAVRFSLGRDNTADEVDRAVQAIDRIMHRSHESIRFVSCR
jgi:cysteine sulfinate desulfinase/cysteine desulfurase-like protein